MVFRDEMLVCDQCGATFFFTVTQQRRMAEELGHQDFEAPHLCPKCRQPQAEPLSASERPLEARPEERAPEPAEEAPEPLAVRAPAFEPKREAVPEPDFETEREPEPAPVQEILPAFDESLLEDIGIKIKLIGQVKWFSRKKGFGFVTKADGEELFFHRSDVLDADVQKLRDGMQVEFDVRRTDKGLEAFDVCILPTA